MKKLVVAGIGPGAEEKMTRQCFTALQEADILIGYQKYLELAEPVFPGKTVYASGMRKEEERCREALILADTGKNVVLLCSGDPGVYGMAAPVLELSKDFPDVRIEILPGVTAALSGAAVLGAPIGHDFAVISLSDLLTPWETIEKRLTGAALADFVIVLYNPASKMRADHLKKACGILLKVKPKDTICGIARNIGRAEESAGVMTLDKLQDYPADMFTTVFIGNEKTKRIGDFMVTPRGYRFG